MSQPVIPIRVQAGPSSRRSFLRYTGASAVVGSLWLAGCKKDEPQLAAPTITSFTPTAGNPGISVAVVGTSFTGVTAVTIGGTAVTQYSVQSTTNILCMVPAGAVTGPITVTTSAGTATSSTLFTVTAGSSTAPTITSFTPASALPGATVVVTGTNFTGTTGVTVNGVTATFTVQSATSLSFQVPTTATAGVATVVITGAGGTGTNTTNFTVLPGAVNLGIGDTGVLNYAYALEQLEAAFYTQVRTGSYYQNANTAEKQILDDLYYHEVIHRDLFKTALGSSAIKSLTPDFSAIDFNSRASVLGAAKLFEDLGVAAYNGAGQYISSPFYLLLAGKIVSVEARHAAVVRDLLAEGTFVGNDIATISTASTYSSAGNANYSPAGSSLERSLLPDDVVNSVNSYLANGSKLALPGTF